MFFRPIQGGGYLPGRLKTTLGTSVSFVRHSYPPVPELSISVLSVGCTQNHTRGMHPGYYPTKNFCKCCRTLTPVPGTSVSYVRPVPQYPGYGYSVFCPRPEFLRVLYACVTIPGTSVSSVTLPYPYPKLLEVL